MKNLYLILVIIGLLAPNILVVMESIETSNWLLWANPIATIEGMFANRISSVFIIDLLLVVMVFIIWSAKDAKKSGVSNVWIIWIATVLLGLSATLPFYLYLREKALNED